MRFEPARGLSGQLSAPADKSISHRAALLGAMASEPVRVERYLHAAARTVRELFHPFAHAEKDCRQA